MTQEKIRRGSDRKERIIQAIVASRAGSDSLGDRQQLRRFLHKYVEDVPFEDLEGRSPGIMARIALAHLDFGQGRRKGRARIRIYNPTEARHGYTSSYTFIEMVNDDMPFLVNSVTAAIGRFGLTVRMTVHPIIRVCRNGNGRIESIPEPGSGRGIRESYIRIAIDRETEPGILRKLEQELRHVLSDVRIAVRDWKKMQSRMVAARNGIESGPARFDHALRVDSMTFLDWLVADHFTFLGYREYRLTERDGKFLLQPVRGTALGVLSRKKRPGHTIELTREMRRLTRSRDWLIITKANSRSTVHRNAYLDYIGVKIFDDDGRVCGEHRFIGLFASAAYSEPPANIPLLRHKIERIFDRAHVEPEGHRGKALLHIINTFPRDELFHAPVQDLARTMTGILGMQDRQRIRFFLRRDTFRRFFSCLVYVPREKYTTKVRQRIESILLDAFEGKAIESSVSISNSALARVYMVVHTPSGNRPRISIQSIEKKISAVVITWSDRLRNRLDEVFGHDKGPGLWRDYRDVFPLGYQEEVTAREACSDISRIEEMLATKASRTVELYCRKTEEDPQLHFMVYSFDEPLALSDALPILEHLGVRVYTERPFELHLVSQRTFWIQDFHLRYEADLEIDVDSVARCFENCFMRVLEGRVESDGLNRQILSAQLNWRETSLLRCYAKHLLQLRLPFSQAYMEDVLVAHSGFVRRLIRLFEAQFDPAIPKNRRQQNEEEAHAAVDRAVAKAKNVDEDRILNSFASAVGATLRTNYFQHDANGNPKPYISVKLDSSQLREAPRPRPKYEIFVYAPEVEGVHLRSGDIARGGLRWSDRREDFRTEVLGLMKAQVVKNSVIVPTGAKGGFVPKRPPAGDRKAIIENGIECYKTFIRGMLDVTDNVVDGKVVTPSDVVRRDGDDPYLVVAADKGTATFSDIANGLSDEYGFWLDDAFASGGSAGYDHKKMGITARGAWEAVKRHFREFGVNIQKDPFTVVGIGDMSGDVFGNGMLLSRKIRLVAAFNHLHIFIDPDPDPNSSFAERKRLFRKARSGWNDYNEALISKGGGIFSRQSKTIRLSPEARRLLNTTQASMQPDQLIREILRIDADLLWNGGIGTYVKASVEGHSDVGDHANDSVRINATELRCKVVGEGGNLGLTQRARIEYSRNGGRINTDFIDNSAGVDCSDHEVNIKILLNDVAKDTRMTRTKRNELLRSMTDDVAALVLRDNYLQTQAISMSEVRSVERIDEMSRLVANLEKAGELDRALEFLPDEAEIEDRRLRKQGFTRPELAIVLSYAKIDLYNGLIESGQTLEDFLVVDPLRYFPDVLRRRYQKYLPTHRLSREILATLIANDLVNRMGPAFVKRAQADTGADVVTVARAYTIARQICEAGSLLQTIEDLDYQLLATTQVDLMFEISRSLRHASYWLIEHYDGELNIETCVTRLKSGMHAIYNRTGAIISTSARRRHQRSARRHMDNKVPEKLANQMSALFLTRPGLDMTDLSVLHGRDVLDLARLYAATNEKLGIYWLHECAEDLAFDHRWQAIARGKLRDEFFLMRRQLAEQILSQAGTGEIEMAVDRWLDERSAAVRRFTGIIEEMKLRDEIDFATLSVAAREFRDLIKN